MYLKVGKTKQRKHNIVKLYSNQNAKMRSPFFHIFVTRNYKVFELQATLERRVSLAEPVLYGPFWHFVCVGLENKDSL